jgi:hypothetical protein
MLLRVLGRQEWLPTIVLLRDYGRQKMGAFLTDFSPSWRLLALNNIKFSYSDPYEIRISSIIKLDEEKNCNIKYIDMEIGNRENNIYIM